MNQPKFSFDDIKFAIDKPTFQKGIKLYEQNKVTNFQNHQFSYSAIVIGTQPYRVSVEKENWAQGTCNCYLGQNNYLCKHMTALAIYSIKQGTQLSQDDKLQIVSPQSKNLLGTLSPIELTQVKSSISDALKYIKPYHGPSSTWFQYQDSLTQGCARLSHIISQLPISPQTAEILIKLLIKLDTKLTSSGVDDSDGTVGEFISQSVNVLIEYSQKEPQIIKLFKKLTNRSTCFEWEEPLLAILTSNEV